MRAHLLPLLLLATLGASCGGDEAASETPAAPAYEPGVPGSEVGYPATVRQADPFGGTLGGGTVQRIQQLPSDPFFQKNYYPGSAVVDVKSIFGSPTVKLVSQASFEDIDAFYAKTFTQEDGTLEGRPGNYYRSLDGGRMERVQIQSADAGGFEILLQM